MAIAAPASPHVPQKIFHDATIDRHARTVVCGTAVARRGTERFVPEDITAVSFVPLTGAHLPQLSAAAAEPLPHIDDPASGMRTDRPATPGVADVRGTCPSGV